MSRKDIKIMETRLRVYTRDGFKCQYPDCLSVGFDNLELAHLISAGKDNRNYIYQYWIDNYGKFLTEKEIDKIIYHPKNMKTSCRKHNSYFNIGGQPEKVKKLLKKIKEVL